MADFWHNQTEIQTALDDIRQIMLDTTGLGNFPLAPDIKHLIKANGKMLRPAFLLLAAEFGRQKKGIKELAAAIELLHIATLIHDDVIDQADTRRGVKTIHKLRDTRGAVLAGDWLLTRCFLLASYNSSPANARLIAQVIGSICAQEIQQNLDAFTWSASKRSYFRKIAGKTAALFSLAFYAGASESGAKPWTRAILTRIGYNTGMAFQIIDDILDFSSSQEEFRKPVGQDLSEGLTTLPLVIAIQGDRSILKTLPQEPPFNAEAKEELIELVKSSGALEKAGNYARLYTDRALTELERLPAGSSRDRLEWALKKLLARNS